MGGLGHENDWGALPINENDYDDTLTADYAIGFLQQEHDKPFFLACGLFRPHLPWYVPQRFFDLYPIQSITLPSTISNDLDDIPGEGLRLAMARKKDLDTILDANKYREAIRAYLASITYADYQIGRVMEALRQSPHAINTIVALWSDHGWHLGEKQHWHKSTLWEESTRVPLIISVPDLPAGRCSKPVSLIHLFPTLTDLTGTHAKTRLDGTSLVPLLKNPDANWNHHAVTEYHSGNATVRGERYRYTRYHDGEEELYDHESDPYEWHNLAQSNRHRHIIQNLKKFLPSKWAKPAATKSAFDFDPKSYSWKNKQNGKTTSGQSQ